MEQSGNVTERVLQAVSAELYVQQVDLPGTLLGEGSRRRVTSLVRWVSRALCRPTRRLESPSLRA
jgi:hypothetical protein